ncbi:chloroplastic,Alpha terpineol synthase [Trichinella spiralis]|uniref:Chloroplastic,Alpha terpineol synthase n=1 Tax=Trichinella spiralis TaxID=6334 RepID=A0ABR3K683_TRISP
MECGRNLTEPECGICTPRKGTASSAVESEIGKLSNAVKYAKRRAARSTSTKSVLTAITDQAPLHIAYLKFNKNVCVEN